MQIPVNHESHDSLAQQAGETRLRECFDYMWHQDEYDPGHDVSDHPGEACPEDPSIAPFCGCDTCQVREVLDAACRYMVNTVNLEAKAVPPGGVVVIKTDTPLPACMSDALAQTISAHVNPAALVVVGSDIDIEMLDPLRMAEHGWVRA